MGKWKVAKTIWPYKPGYGVYKQNRLTGARTILDTGLTKADAEAECKRLNNKK